MSDQQKQLPESILKVKEYFTNKKIPARIVFIVVGLLSTIWFLIRVIPKPSRATYPCMQATMPVMSGFVAYLFGITATFVAYKKAKVQMANAKYITAAAFMVIAISAVIFTMTEEPQIAYAETESLLAANTPIGVARGINPGRVVWVWNPDATNENCTNSLSLDAGVKGDPFWKDYNTYQKVVDSMMIDAIKSVANKATVAENWDAIFKHFNNRHGKGEVGYVPGETIFIKPNLCIAHPKFMSTPLNSRPNTNDHSLDSTRYRERYSRGSTTPQAILSVIRQLVYECGVPDTCIVMGDPQKEITKNIYDPFRAEFPGLILLALMEREGRRKVVVSDTTSIFYSDKGAVLSKENDYLCKSMEDADYLIAIPALKSHEAAGITVTGKNHFGSIGIGQYTPGRTPAVNKKAGHLHPGLVDQDGGRFDYGMYRVVVDLMSHKYLGENTLLYIVDGLWCGGPKAIGWPNKWKSAPFNNDWPSSILISQDQVALGSVCLDLLQAEYNRTNYPVGDSVYSNMPAADDFLMQAADSSYWPEGLVYDPENDGILIPSLGVFEHWNNATDKQYSRDLGTGDGIELVKIVHKPTNISQMPVNKPGSF